jgi:hypothetical protein
VPEQQHSNKKRTGRRQHRPEEGRDCRRKEDAENPDQAADEEQPADIEIDGDRRNLRPDNCKHAKNGHDRALHREKLPVLLHGLSDGTLNFCGC